MPRAAEGLVERPDPKTTPRFLKLAIPQRRRYHELSERAKAIDSLRVGGDAYIIPVNGADPKILAARVTVAAAGARKRTGGGLRHPDNGDRRRSRDRRVAR